MPDGTPDLSAALGAAIAKAIGDRYRKDIATAAGVPAPTVTRWVQGEVRPSLEQIRALEDACGVGPGWVLTAAGYITATTTLEEAIRADVRLDAAGRHFVEGALRSALELRASEVSAEPGES